MNGLRAAEAVERLGSLSAAARELEVSTGAVSQQIARLEAALGRTLFDRRPGGMRPLPGTEEIFRLLGNGFDHLSAAVDLTRRDRHSTLTVSVAPIFAARWLIWRIPDFSRAHPDIRIRLDSDVALVDPNTGGAGVFLAFETLCIDALNRGQITAPFPEWKTTGGQYWLISARDRSLTTPQRRFRQWLMDAIATEGMGSSPVPSHGQ